MKKKSRFLLIVGALLGAVVTGALIVSLLGEGDSRRRGGRDGAPYEARRDSDDRRDGTRVVQVVDEARLRREQQKKYGSRFPGLVPPGTRVPFDSPEAEADRQRLSLEILALMQKIRSNESSDKGQNQAWMLELKQKVRKLGYRLPRQTRDELVAMIDSVEPKWRRLVGAVLGELRGDKETAAALMAKLQERPEDPYTRDALLNAITNMGVKEVLPALKLMLGEGHDREDLIARAIGRLGGRESADTLLAYLEKTPINPTTGREIERILGAGGDPVILAKVEKGLASANAEKRLSMLRVLGGARKKEYAAAIRAMLDGETDPRVTGAAISALGKIGDPESGELLLTLAQSSDATTSNRAVNAITSIRDSKTVNGMVKNWDKLDAKARFAVMGAAARVLRPSDEVVKVARDSLYDDNERVRNYAARVLGQSRKDEHVEVLGSFLRGAKSTRERSVALDSLRRIGSAKAAEEVLRSIGSLPEQQQGSVRDQFQQIAEKHERIRRGNPGARRR